jgi:hypothetical protein
MPGCLQEIAETLPLEEYLRKPPQFVFSGWDKRALYSKRTKNESSSTPICPIAWPKNTKVLHVRIRA